MPAEVAGEEQAAESGQVGAQGDEADVQNHTQEDGQAGSLHHLIDQAEEEDEDSQGNEVQNAGKETADDAPGAAPQGQLDHGGDGVHHRQVKGAQNQDSSRLGEKDLSLAHRAHEGEPHGVVGLFPHEEVAGGHHGHEGQEDHQNEGQVGVHQVSQQGLGGDVPRPQLTGEEVGRQDPQTAGHADGTA